MQHSNVICPTIKFNNILGGKWKLSIIYHLKNKKMRFGKLATVIDGISRKVLSDQLKQLEEDGLITKKSFNEVPPRVEYTLTKRGDTLDDIFIHIDKWVKNHY